MIIQQNQFGSHDMSKLIKGAVVPRPVAWVSSVSKGGNRNLAPFSFFTVASMNPITLCFSVGSSNREKDTIRNVRETNQFVINIASESLANQMYESSKAYLPHEDEFHKAGVAPAESSQIQVPLVAQAPVNMECELDQIIKVGVSDLVLGKVVAYHIAEDVYMETDKVNPHQLKPVGRMAGDYSYIREFYQLPK